MTCSSSLFRILFILKLVFESNQKSVSVVLLDNVKAPLVADLDMSQVQQYIDVSLLETVKTEMDKTLPSRINIFITSLLSNISTLKSDNKELKAEIINLKAGLQKIKGQTVSNSLRCQSGTFGQQAEPSKRRARRAIVFKPNHKARQNLFPKPNFPSEMYIKFNPPFSSTPSFVYGITHLNSDWKKNTRQVADILQLTGHGVKFRLYSSAESIMFGLRISWMACPN